MRTRRSEVDLTWPSPFIFVWCASHQNQLDGSEPAGVMSRIQERPFTWATTESILRQSGWRIHLDHKRPDESLIRRPKLEHQPVARKCTFAGNKEIFPFYSKGWRLFGVGRFDFLPSGAGLPMPSGSAGERSGSAGNYLACGCWHRRSNGFVLFEMDGWGLRRTLLC